VSHAAGLPRAVALLPTRNAEPFIEATLTALGAQTYPHFAVLISDDASTDRTPAICERFAQADGRFRFLRQTRQLGWVGNSNALLQAARGDYLFFAAHDDLVAPTYVASLVDALERDPAAVLAFSDGEKLTLDNESEVWSFAELDGLGGLEQAVRIARQRPGWPVPFRGVFRASAAQRVGGLRRHLAGEFGADWPWLLRLSLLGGFVRVPQPLFRKVARPESLARTWEYGFRDWVGVTLSCVREVRHAALAPRAELRLDAQLGRTCLRLLLRAAVRATRGPSRASLV